MRVTHQRVTQSVGGGGHWDNGASAAGRAEVRSRRPTNPKFLAACFGSENLATPPAASQPTEVLKYGMVEGQYEGRSGEEKR